MRQTAIQTVALTVLGVALAFAAPLCALGSSARAAEGSTPGFDATFVLAEGGSGRIEAAVADVVEEANPFVRPIARRRLLHQNRAFETLRFRVTDGRIVAHLGKAPPVASPADGSAAWYEVPGGDRARVRQKRNGRVLVQHYRTGDGERVNRFALSPDGGTLDYRVKVSSGYLPSPLRYALRYRRAD
ncbi:MAG: hypothetical protein ACOCXM_06400 [Myxococcota bacterium]